MMKIIWSNYHYNPFWILVIITIPVILVGYLFSSYNTKITHIFNGLIFWKKRQQSLREDNIFSDLSSLLLSINFILTGSIFFLQSGIILVNQVLKFDFSFISLLIVIFGILLLYVLKTIIIRILGFIFNRQFAAKEYLGIVYLINHALGVCLVPVLIINAYASENISNWASDLGVVLLVSFFIIRLIKGVTIFLSMPKSSSVYLFLYLCTFELAPLIFGYKLIEKLV